MEKCPVTGKSCSNQKVFHIDEITDTDTKHVVLCHICAKPYFEDSLKQQPSRKRGKTVRGGSGTPVSYHLPITGDYVWASCPRGTR